jgi:hypothetical protein
MAGGFGVSSDRMRDVMAGAACDIGATVSLFVGYRATGVGHSSDGFVFDVTQAGPVIEGVFGF